MNIFVTASNALYKNDKSLSANLALKYGKFDKAVAYDCDSQIDDEF